MTPAPMQPDALLDALAGQADPLALDAQDPGLSEDPLEVKEPAAPNPIKAMDAKFSTRAGGKGYAVEVAGDYYAMSEERKGKVKKPYSIVVNLASLDAAMSVIKKNLLERAIRAKYPDYVGVHTHHIVKATPLSPETPESSNLQFMPRERLERYIADHRVPVDPANYKDVVVLRETVVDYTLNPVGFEAREAEKQKKRAEQAELAALNPDLIPAP